MLKRIKVEDAVGTHLAHDITEIRPGEFKCPAFRFFGCLAAACIIGSPFSILLLPGILAGEKIGKKELAFFGHGGLCKDCPQCSYPHCPFGKGI